MTGLGIHKNLRVFNRKWMRGPQLGFIRADLTMDKLFPVNLREIASPPKMALLLEAKCTTRLIIKPRLILVCTWMILVTVGT